MNDVNSATYRGGIAYVADAGALNAIAFTQTTRALIALVDGASFVVKVLATNTISGVTLNANGLGAKTVFRQNGAVLVAGDLVAGQLYEFVYNSTLAGGAWQLIGIVSITSPASSITYTALYPFAANGATIQAALDQFNGAGPWSGFRNIAVNGGIDIDQVHVGAVNTVTAGATFPAPGLGYVVDGFYAWCTGANVTAQQVAGIGPTSANNLLQINGAASVTGAFVGQKFESVSTNHINGSVIFSVALASTLITSVTWTAYAPGATDNWTTRSVLATGVFTINSTLTTKFVRIDTLGSAVNSGFSIELSFGALTSGNVQLGEFSVTQCAASQVIVSVDKFEKIPFEIQLIRCQRFYEQSFAYGTAPAQNAGVANAASFAQTVVAGAAHRGQFVACQTKKRNNSSTLVTYNTNAANTSVRNQQRSLDVAPANILVYDNGFVFTINGVAGSIAGDQNTFHWSLDCRL